MKALTVLQPYAALLVTIDPATGLPVKRVENRTWKTDYRGALYIHAGKGRQMLTDTAGAPPHPADNYGIPVAAMQFGAVIAVAKLTYCAMKEAIRDGKLDRSMPWLRHHEHAEGPWCWILEDVRTLAEPYPVRGSQGLFDLDDREHPHLARLRDMATGKVRNTSQGLPF